MAESNRRDMCRRLS